MAEPHDAYVFMSHAAKDRTRADELTDALERLGIPIRSDRNLAPGDRWDEALASLRAGAAAVMVVWSNAAADSDFVKGEAAEAIASGRLVPVSIEGVDVVPAAFRQHFTLDLSDWRAGEPHREFDRLVDTLRQRVLAGTSDDSDDDSGADGGAPWEKADQAGFFEDDIATSKIAPTDDPPIATVDTGEGWIALAARLLGDAGRAEELARLNGGWDRVLQPGDLIRLPADLDAGESTADSSAAPAAGTDDGDSRAAGTDEAPDRSVPTESAIDEQGRRSGQAEKQPEPKVTRDYWTIEDHLGYGAYARAVAGFIRHRDTRPPLTIGIKGPWGAGKTSIMRMVQRELDPPRHPDAATWKFEEVRLSAAGLAPGVGDAPTPRWWRRMGRRSGGRPTDRSTGSQTSVRDGLTIGTVLQQSRDPFQVPLDQIEPVVPAEGVKSASGAPGPDREEEWRPTVWFNPWMYQTGEEVWAGLAHEIITQTTSRLPRWQREWFWLQLNLRRVDEQALRGKIYRTVLDRLIGPAIVLTVSLVVAAAAAIVNMTVSDGAWALEALSSLGGVGVIAGLVSGAVQIVRTRSQSAANVVPAMVNGPVAAAIEGFGQDMGAVSEILGDPEYGQRAGFLYLLQHDVHHVLDIVATPEQPLVVFVDDLDRCSPGVVAQTLEAINLFLAGEFPNCIFVLAVEPAVVAAHVEAAHEKLVEQLQAYGIGNEWSSLGWRFLEKIVQLPLNISRPDSRRLDEYIGSLFEPAGGAPDRESELYARLVDGGADAKAARTIASADTAETLNEMLRRSSREPRSIDDIAEAQNRLADQLRSRGVTDDVVAPLLRVARIEALPHLYSDADEHVQRIIRDEARRLPGRNPREIKRLVNLVRFYTLVANERLLIDTDDTETFDVTLRRLARIAHIAIRWPYFMNVFAAPADAAEPDLPDGARGPVALEDLEDAAGTKRWATVLERHGLAEVRDGSGEIVPLPMWRDALSDVEAYLAAGSPRIGELARSVL